MTGDFAIDQPYFNPAPGNHQWPSVTYQQVRTTAWVHDQPHTACEWYHQVCDLIKAFQEADAEPEIDYLAITREVSG